MTEAAPSVSAPEQVRGAATSPADAGQGGWVVEGRAAGSALLRLGRHQGVAAAPQVEPANNVEAHDRKLDGILGMPVSERRHDRRFGPGHAVAEQHWLWW